MKNIVFSLFAVSLLSLSTLAQTKGTQVEVLYFKAQLACCQARSCNALEADVKKAVESNYQGKNVVFKEVKLTDPANENLKNTYQAKSQTVVVVATKRGKTQSVDVSDLVRDYSRNRDYDSFQTRLCEKINKLI